MTAINVTSHSRAWLGVVVALAAAAGYAVANTSASLAYQGGSNPLTVAATRFLVPTVALIVWLRLSGLSLMLPKRDTLIAVLLGFITALYTWATAPLVRRASVRSRRADFLFVSVDRGGDRCGPRLAQVCLANRCRDRACAGWFGAGARRARRQPQCRRCYSGIARRGGTGGRHRRFQPYDRLRRCTAGHALHGRRRQRAVADHRRRKRRFRLAADVVGVDRHCRLVCGLRLRHDRVFHRGFDDRTGARLAPVLWRMR